MADKAKNAFKPEESTVQEIARTQRELAATYKAIIFVNKEIKEALEHEKQAQCTLKEAIKTAIHAIENAPSEGVTIVSKSPICGTIRFSTIMENGSVLAPEFYMQPSQAELVQGQLKNARTVNDVLNSIREMTVTGKVRTSSGTQRLNKTTIDVLKQFLTG